MASSKSNRGYLFDTFRRHLVEKTPEEIVRQRLLAYMCAECGFPKSLIAVEKSLKEIPHLGRLPHAGDRRIDILCFARDIHPDYPIYPLLLAECKAGAISVQAVEQAFGYNAHVGAAFILLVNPQELRLYAPRAGHQSLTFIPHLLHFEELVRQAQCLYAS